MHTHTNEYFVIGSSEGEKNYDSLIPEENKKSNEMDFEEDLNCLIDETVPENTKKVRNGEVKFLKIINCERNSVDIDLHTTSEEELAGVLKRFYTNIRKKSGELYTPSALVGIRSAIHRKITSPPYERSINIVSGDKFIAANRIFNAKCKVYTKRGNPKPKHKSQITDADMQKLGMYFQDYSKTPTKLIQYVWFGMCYYFGRRDREGWRDLKAHSYQLKLDEENHEYLTENTTLMSKNHQGGPRVTDNDYSDPRVYDVTFLKAYKLYFEKRNPSCDAFF